MATLANRVEFSQIDATVPDIAEIAREYAMIEAGLAGRSVPEKLAAISRWDDLRRRLITWGNLTSLRFQQDTSNVDYRKAKEHADDRNGDLTENRDRKRDGLARKRNARLDDLFPRVDVVLVLAREELAHLGVDPVDV